MVALITQRLSIMRHNCPPYLPPRNRDTSPEDYRIIAGYDSMTILKAAGCGGWERERKQGERAPGRVRGRGNFLTYGASPERTPVYPKMSGSPVRQNGGAGGR